MGYRTSRIVIRKSGKHKAFYRITMENMLHARAVYNTALFHIRNLFTGLKKSEDKITENEMDVIRRVCEAIDEINEKRSRSGKKAYNYSTPDAPWLSDYLWLSVMNRILKKELPRPETFYSKLEQTTIRSACRAMKSFTVSLSDYSKHPDKYPGRPKLPHYIKADTFTLDYDSQMVQSMGEGRKHRLKLSAIEPCIKTGKKKFSDIVSVRLSYRHGEIIANICVRDNADASISDSAYAVNTSAKSNVRMNIKATGNIKAEGNAHTKTSPAPDEDTVSVSNRVLMLTLYHDRIAGVIEAYGLNNDADSNLNGNRNRNSNSNSYPDPDRMLGIDPGVKNFLTVCPGYGDTPFIIRSGKLKSMNRYYNKRKAELQCKLKKKHDRYTSHRLHRLESRRENFLYNYFHQTARLVVNYALRERVSTIVIGRNKGWKQNVNMRKKENQRFVYIPFARFFKVLEDKAVREGIKVVFTEESYTSKACCLTRDPIPDYDKDRHVPKGTFHGRREKRGLYVCEDGRKMNADVNGGANIIRKYNENGLQEDLTYLTGPVKVVRVA